MTGGLPGYDQWLTTPPEEPPCVCNAPDCDECAARQEDEDREAWAVDMAIDERRELEWER
jgi:hypothetical protein